MVSRQSPSLVSFKWVLQDVFLCCGLWGLVWLQFEMGYLALYISGCDWLFYVFSIFHFCECDYKPYWESVFSEKWYKVLNTCLPVEPHSFRLIGGTAPLTSVHPQLAPNYLPSGSQPVKEENVPAVFILLGLRDALVELSRQEAGSRTTIGWP